MASDFIRANRFCFESTWNSPTIVSPRWKSLIIYRYVYRPEIYCHKFTSLFTRICLRYSSGKAWMRDEYANRNIRGKHVHADGVYSSCCSCCSIFNNFYFAKRKTIVDKFFHQLDNEIKRYFYWSLIQRIQRTILQVETYSAFLSVRNFADEALDASWNIIELYINPILFVLFVSKEQNIKIIFLNIKQFYFKANTRLSRSRNEGRRGSRE